MDSRISLTQWLLIFVGAFLTMRLVSLGLYPLFDTTEARYGEIARIMFETQNWVTPQFDYDTPFWGKPPLYTWLSAASFSLLGVSEFTARLPHFLVGSLIVLLVYRFSAKVANKEKAALAAVVLCSCLGFIVAMGMVMTDTVLLLSITLAMISFWLCFNGDNTVFYGRLFFAALALGMLAKGPVAVVLVGIALFVWTIYSKQLVKALKCLPWISGIALFLVLTLPWYIWAEIRTPGFLNYFLIGEHFYRFVEPGWEGDLYGSAHDQPKGMIWVFWLAAAFPWSFVLIYRAIKTKGFKVTAQQQSTEQNNLVSYLVAWVISPMLLFSLAGNILPIYVMPGFAALAVLVALMTKSLRHALYVSIVSFVLVASALVALSVGAMNKSSESELLAGFEGEIQSEQLFYWQRRPFSAQFYSQGKAKLIDKESDLNQLLNSQTLFFLVAKRKDAKLIEMVEGYCQPIVTSRKRTLFKCH